MAPTSTDAAWRGSRLYFAFYGTLAAWLPFLNVYFRGLGLSGLQIGILSACIPAATFLLSAPLTHVADRHGRHVPMLALASAGLGLSLLFLAGVDTFWLLFLSMMVLAIAYSPTVPLADSTIASMGARHGIRYGDMRLWGSFSFALVSIAGGALWQHAGYRPMFAVSAVLYLGVAWLSRSLDDAVVITREERVPLRALAADRYLVLLLVATFLISAAVGMDMAFTGVYMTHLGGGGFYVGLVAGLSAMCELPTMRYSERVIRRLGGPTCLFVAYGLFGVAYIGYAVSPSPAVMVGFSVLRGFAYGLFYASTVFLLNSVAPPEWSGTLQGIMNALALGLAQLISRPLSGAIYDGLGPSAVFIVAAVVVVAAMIVIGSVAISSAGTLSRAPLHTPYARIAGEEERLID